MWRLFTKKAADFLKDEGGGVVEWLLVLIACAILCSVIYKNLAPGIKSSTGKMGNALTGNN